MLERRTTRALSFDEARARIEAGIGAPPSKINGGVSNGALEFGLSQNQRCVRMVLPGLDGTALSELLEAVGKYFAIAPFDFPRSQKRRSRTGSGCVFCRCGCRPLERWSSRRTPT